LLGAWEPDWWLPFPARLLRRSDRCWGWLRFRGLEPLEPASSCCLGGCRLEETEDPPVVGLSPAASSVVEEDVGR
jgi:hypothetical protein